MNIAKYTYISPYSSPIQVGRLDPSSVEDNTKEESMQTDKETLSLASQEQQLKELQIVENSTKEKRGDLSVSSSSLDLYA